MDTKKIKDWIKHNSKAYLIDSTAVCTVANPIYALIETNVAGMSDETSIKARILGTLLTYVGMGSAISKGSDFSRKLFKITDKTKEKIQFIHDATYLAAFNAAIGPIFYYASGSRDPKEIALGTLGGLCFGLVSGYPFRYSIDTHRDLSGLGVCERKSYPSLIKNRSSKFKKSLVGFLAAASIATTIGIYALTPEKKVPNSAYITQPVADFYLEDRAREN